MRPDFTKDSDDIACLGFNSKRLGREHVLVIDLDRVNGDTTTFCLIHCTVNRTNQLPFNWVRLTGTNTYDISTRLGFHIPWSTGVVHTDHANSAKGRLSVRYIGNHHREIIAYSRNGSIENSYLNTVHGKRQTELTNKFNHIDL